MGAATLGNITMSETAPAMYYAASSVGANG
jgi:hypothetical protein